MKMNMDDKRLLERYVEFGDADAFEIVAGRYSALIFSTCLSLLRQPQDAEDARQQVLLLLATHAETLCEYRSLEAWLRRTSRSVAIDQYRNSSASRRRENKIRDNWRNESHINSDLCVQLNDELRTLSERQREAIRLVHFCGFSLELTAQSMNCSKRTVSSLLASSLQHLRRRWMDEVSCSRCEPLAS